MAAVAYDVAALALRGSDAVLNFPESVRDYPGPASASPADIRSAANAAAAAVKVERDRKAEEAAPATEEEYVDMEALFDMPGLLVDMAEGMMVSPPRIRTTVAEVADSPEYFIGGDCLWSYD
ncbi:hypothetical protein V2J09_014697 [Rumex salicifolius]